MTDTQTPERICDYCFKTDPIQQAECPLKYCGMAEDAEETPERIWVRFSPTGNGADVSLTEPSDLDEKDKPYVFADVHQAVVAERNHAIEVANAAKEEIERLRECLNATSARNRTLARKARRSHKPKAEQEGGS